MALVGVVRCVRAESPESVTLTGRVRLLGEVLKERKISADAALVGDPVVLEGADGKISALLPNGASKALFLDERLRDRPAEISAWKHEGLPSLEVVSLRVEEKGKLRTPEYFCEVCTISVRYPQDCPCCQGPMELRYKPAED
jgi:hypothetical protein